MTERVIELTVATTYVPTWGLWQAVREIAQNGVDGRTRGFPLTVEHTPSASTLLISNTGVTIPREVWLLGATNKADATDQRGVYGEGMKLATLAAVRAGHRVVVVSGKYRWTPQLVHSESWGRTVLALKEEERQTEVNAVMVYIDGISTDMWEDYQSFLPCLLSTDDDKPSELLRTPLKDRISEEQLRVVWRTADSVRKVDILPQKSKQILVRGIWVQAIENLAYGYDILSTTVKLDRDRGMADRDAMLSVIGYSWVHALIAAGKDPSWMPAAKRLYDLLNGPEVLDLYNFMYQLPSYVDAYTVLSDLFIEMHGLDAVPVSTESERLECTHHAVVGVMVSPRLQKCLELGIEGLKKRKTRTLNALTKVYNSSELTSEERLTLARAVALLDRSAVQIGLKSITDRVRVADLRAANGIHFEDGRIFLGRHILNSLTETIRILGHEVAHDRGVDGEKSHELAEGQLGSNTIHHLLMSHFENSQIDTQVKKPAPDPIDFSDLPF